MGLMPLLHRGQRCTGFPSTLWTRHRHGRERDRGGGVAGVERAEPAGGHEDRVSGPQGRRSEVLRAAERGSVFEGHHRLTLPRMEMPASGDDQITSSSPR